MTTADEYYGRSKELVAFSSDLTLELGTRLWPLFPNVASLNVDLPNALKFAFQYAGGLNSSPGYGTVVNGNFVFVLINYSGNSATIRDAGANILGTLPGSGATTPFVFLHILDSSSVNGVWLLDTHA